MDFTVDGLMPDTLCSAKRCVVFKLILKFLPRTPIISEWGTLHLIRLSTYLCDYIKIRLNIDLLSSDCF